MDKIVDLITSPKFYGPIIYVILGILFFKIVTNISKKIRLRKKDTNKKRETIFKLINSIIKYTIITIIVLMVLELYGVNTTSILASLGIVGFVVGLAFQDTMKNALAGIAIILDNRYNVGDTVKINDYTGEVLNLGLQTTKLKALTGDVFTISNSAITSVVNYSEFNTTLYIDIPVSYTTDIEKLENVLKNLNDKVKNIENVVSDLKVLGLETFTDSSIIYKVAIDTLPYKFWNVKREFQKLLKITFDKEGIEIPFNQIDVHIKER